MTKATVKTNLKTTRLAAKARATTALLKDKTLIADYKQRLEHASPLNTAVEAVKAPPIIPGGIRILKRPDLHRFANSLRDGLRNAGYDFSFAIQKNGERYYEWSEGWAENPTGHSVGWSPDTKQHVASVSKLIAAVGLRRAMTQHRHTQYSRIADFLPAHWDIASPGVLTFRHVLRHESGLESANGEYKDLVRVLKPHRPNFGSYLYSNANFGLLRLAIPIMNGDLRRDASYAVPGVLSNDQGWDLLSQSHFQKYMQNEVLKPAGIDASHNSNRLPIRLPGIAPANMAIYYRHGSTDSTKGEDATPHALSHGGAIGWHLSVNELLKFADHARRRGTIISAAALRDNFRQGFGAHAHETDAGVIYYHDGAWTINGYGILAYLGFLPGGVEIAALLNRAIDGAPGLVQHIHDRYRESMP